MPISEGLMAIMNTAPADTACTDGAAGRQIILISFGYLHQPGEVPPPADRVEDVRERLRDPAAARDGGILDLDGLHPRVQQVVLATPGAAELIDNLAAYAELPAGPRSIAVGCAGGKHRACAIIQLLGERLRERGHHVTIDHRHAHRPRVLKPAADSTVGTAAATELVLTLPDEPLPLSSQPRPTEAAAGVIPEPDITTDQMQRRVLRSYAECSLTVIPLLIAALNRAPALVVIILAVLSVVALIRFMLLAPAQSDTHH
jgi:UPF0042 nucleotide-binding protein